MRGIAERASQEMAWRRRTLSQAGWREQEPDEPPIEQGSLLIKAVRRLAESGRQRVADLAEAIALRQSTVEDLITGAIPQPSLSLPLS